MTYRLVPEEQRLMIISITNAHDIFWLKQKKKINWFSIICYYIIIIIRYYIISVVFE